MHSNTSLPGFLAAESLLESCRAPRPVDGRSTRARRRRRNPYASRGSRTCEQPTPTSSVEMRTLRIPRETATKNLRPGHSRPAFAKASEHDAESHLTPPEIITKKQGASKMVALCEPPKPEKPNQDRHEPRRSGNPAKKMFRRRNTRRNRSLICKNLRKAAMNRMSMMQCSDGQGPKRQRFRRPLPLAP